MRNSNRILPDFLVVGAQKSGTTTLFELLRQHSHIFLPVAKELHFFDYPENYQKGLDYYSSLFLGAQPNDIVGEITPSYLFDPTVPEKIFHTLGKQIKIIILFRNPSDRAISHYKMEFSRRREKRSFPQIVSDSLPMVASKKNYTHNTSYIERGLYAEQVSRYLRFFNRENMLFLIFEEDILINRGKTMNRIFSFLGLKPENIFTDIHKRKASFYRWGRLGNIIDNPTTFPVLGNHVVRLKVFTKFLLPLLNKFNNQPFPDTHAMTKMKTTVLNQFYLKDIKNLEKLIGRNLGCWYNGNSKSNFL